MAWDLATAKKYLNLEGDNSQDELIQARLDYTLASIETLLGRELLLARTTMRVQCHWQDTKVQLPRAPVATVHTINGASPPSDLLIESDTGIICHSSLAGTQPIDIDFEGGYDPLPLDLEGAMWGAFMAAWSAIDPATGGPPSDGSGGIIQGSGDVKSLTVFDAFKVDYDVGTTSAGGEDTGTISIADWGWLAPWGSVLSYYRWGPAGADGLGIA